MRHIISALVENKAGVLAHVAGLFSARGYNIESLNVGVTENPRFSRMTIVTTGEENIIEQIRKQLEKLIPIVKVSDFMGQEYVERELVLIKVNAPPTKRGELTVLVELFRAKVVDVSEREMIVEISGASDKVNALLELLQPHGVKEIARTGSLAMLRGTK
jgi:acetolactate synthase I/III small subunit